MFCDLVDVATGRREADLLISNVNIINVFTKEVLRGWNIAVVNGKVAYVGEEEKPSRRVFDGGGLYASPGFMDGHIHIESSMLTPVGFAEVVLPRGTTAVFMDPHEIANVLGVRGVELLVEEGRRSPLRFFLTVPSCVPALGDPFETPGAEFDLDDIERLLRLPESVALGEMMDFPGVISCSQRATKEIKLALELGKVVEGHAPSLPYDWLNAYISAGISSCHESTSPAEALSKLRLGMHVMVREGSGWRDLRRVLSGLLRDGADLRRVVLVSDDRHPGDLLARGHVDGLLRLAVESGADPLDAVRMVTLNVAEHFHVDGFLGAIAPGRYADIVLLKDLGRFEVVDVFVGGVHVAHGGRLLTEMRRPKYPEWATNTVNVGRIPGPDELAVKVEEGSLLNVIEVRDGSALTGHLRLRVEEPLGLPDPSRDLSVAVSVERHHGTGRYRVGVVTGFGLRRGGVASTVAHDSHNIIGVGADARDLAIAVKRVVELRGGMVSVVDGEVTAELPLPLAGLMSLERGEEVASAVEGLERAWREMGCGFKDPFMTLSLLSLPVIPELRLTDRGLVDVNRMKLIPLVESSL